MLHSLRKGVKTLIFYVQFDRSKLTLSICKKCLVPVFRPCEMLLLVGTPWVFFWTKLRGGSFTIQKISLQILSILSSIFWS